MKTHKIETWLPLFPGFYNTHFEFNYEELLWQINEDRLDKGLNEIEDIDLIEIDNSAYEHEVVKQFCDQIETDVNELIDGNIKISLQGIQSPREYNFHNDSGNILIEMSDDDLKKLRDKIYDHLNPTDEHDYCIKQYLKDRYTSGSGFISFYSNAYQEWEDETDGFLSWEENSHYLGAMLDGLLTITGPEEQDISILEQLEVYELDYVRNLDDVQNSHVCHMCGDKLVDTSWRHEYDTVCKEFARSWNLMTGGQDLPEFYKFKDWIGKQNTYQGRVCADCIDDYTEEEIVEQLNWEL